MRLDIDALTVQSFSTAQVEKIDNPSSDTGPAGPYSYCYICRPTDPGVPSCDWDACDA